MAGVKSIVCRLSLDEFQRDVLLSAVSKEITQIQQTRDVPVSLKTLAINGLSKVKKVLEDSLDSPLTED